MSSQQPTIVYVDDEPHNLVVFEAAVPDTWKVVTFDNPVSALQKLEELVPSVIVSDQRMPGMMGVQFLELASKIRPNAVRIMATGYSDEDLIVESVRKAHIFDYIRKPWDVEDLTASLSRALDFYSANEESRRLQIELLQREKELTDRNSHLVTVLKELEDSKRAEQEMRRELESWVPPFILQALQKKNIQFPVIRDLVGITFDIIQSSRLHDLALTGKPLRAQILQLFSEAIIRHGGWRESSAGDSAYGHFGLFNENQNPADAALAVAREFRVALRNLSQLNSVQVECGIALHTAKDCVVDIHSVQLQTPQGPVAQKTFDTAGADVDLLHRMEKLVHSLPGSNIIMSKSFMDALKSSPNQFVNIGAHLFAGQKQSVELYLITSDLVNEQDLRDLISKAVNKDPHRIGA